MAASCSACSPKAIAAGKLAGFGGQRRQEVEEVDLLFGLAQPAIESVGVRVALLGAGGLPTSGIHAPKLRQDIRLQAEIFHALRGGECVGERAHRLLRLLESPQDLAEGCQPARLMAAIARRPGQIERPHQVFETLRAAPGSGVGHPDPAQRALFERDIARGGAQFQPATECIERGGNVFEIEEGGPHADRPFGGRRPVATPVLERS